MSDKDQMRNSRPKVLMIGPVPPPFGGGMGAYMHILLESHLPEKVRTSIIDTTVPQFFVKYRKFRFVLSLWFLLQIVFKQIFVRPKITHIHTSAFIGFWEKAIFVVFSRLLGSKVLLHVHGSEFEIFYNGSKQKDRIAKILNRCEKVIALSDSWAEFFKKMLPDHKISVIQNGVHLQPFSHAAINDKICRILFVGALGERKGLYTILKAIQDTPGLQSAEVEFNMLGGETYYGDYDKVVAAFAVAKLDNVKFHGIVSGEPKHRFFRESDIFMLPSFAEGLPIAIIEAMASSLPLISTTVGGIPDMVKTENGILIEPGDSSGLANALLQYINDPDRRVRTGQLNRRKVEQDYSAEAVATKVLNLYHQVAESGS